MPAVDLIYDDDCPNVASTRTNLIRAFSRSGWSPRWREWNRHDPTLPAHLSRFGSPSVVIDGRDVAADDGGASDSCCRVYAGPDGRFDGAPSVDAIADVLGSAPPPSPPRSSWSSRASGFAVVPGLLLALLPKVTCPACWPAYAGVLSALGLSFLLQTTWLLPLTLASLGGMLAVLAWGARRGRGLWPVLLGTAASLVAVVGKFVLEKDVLLYTGIALLVIASMWNALAKPREPTGSCPACIPVDADVASTKSSADDVVGITRRES